MKIIKAWRGAVLAAGLAAWTVVTAQTYYKWKDAGGTVHYTETPPPAKKATTLRLRLGGEAPAAITLIPATAASSGDSEKNALKMAEAQYQKQACLAARKDVAVAQSNALLVSGKDATTARQLSNDERAKAREDAEARVGQYCETGHKP